MCATCDAAYFAGLVDGEGYIGIRTVRHTGGFTSFALQVTVTNMNREVLEAGRARWGGSIHRYAGKKRPCFKWQVTCRKAAAMLADLYSYLRIKQAQAEVALELQSRIDAIADRRARSKAEVETRLNLQILCRDLNQRSYNGEYVKPRLRAVGGGCATCGCLQPENAHGDKHNILVSEFKASALKTRVAPGSESAALRNVRRTLNVTRRRRK